jgi:branched-chain amino acid transport system substrate-binding protein
MVMTAFLVVSCGRTGSGAANPSATAFNATTTSGTAETVNIGEDGHLTGATAVFGVPIHNGLLQALDEVKASGYLAGTANLNLETQDDASQVPNAVTIFNHYVQKKYPIVIVDNLTPVYAALTPLANDAKTLVLSPGTNGTGVDTPGYSFRMNDGVGPLKAEGRYLAEKRGAKRVGVIIDGDNAAFAQLAKNLLAGLQAGGVNDWATSLTISARDTDFSSILTNVRQANVDTVAVFLTPPQSGNMLRQMKQFGGFERVTKVGHIGWGTPVSQIAGDAATGAIFAVPWLPGSDAFTTEYARRYNDQPNAYSAFGHDAGWLVAVAVKKIKAANKAVNGTTLRDILPDASTSPDYVSHALIKGLTLAASGAPSSSGSIVTFAADGKVIEVK